MEWDSDFTRAFKRFWWAAFSFALMAVVAIGTACCCCCQRLAPRQRRKK